MFNFSVNKLNKYKGVIMDYFIREIKSSEYAVLEDFLYEAIFQPDDNNLLPRDKGYNKVSLAVQKENYAYKMYKNIGFKIFEKKEEEYLMLYEFK